MKTYLVSTLPTLGEIINYNGRQFRLDHNPQQSLLSKEVWAANATSYEEFGPSRTHRFYFIPSKG